MIKIGLFVDGLPEDTLFRSVVPQKGETIVIDCGFLVEVVEVNHPWDDPTFVQVNTKRIEGSAFMREEAEG